MQDVVSLIWKAWPQNPVKTAQRIESFSELQTEGLIFQYGGPSDIFFRFRKLQTLSEQLLNDHDPNAELFEER
jgi:hypothetical protein